MTHTSTAICVRCFKTSKDGMKRKDNLTENLTIIYVFISEPADQVN